MAASDHSRAVNDERLPFHQRLLMAAIASFRSLSSPVAFGAHAIVEDGDGRVVLVRHSYQNGWAFPGGGVGCGEPPEQALLRELKEEVGLLRSAPPKVFGIYTRRLGIATNVIALYRVREAVIAFRPNFEVREIVLADPANPPAGTMAGVRRRLAELSNGSQASHRW